MDQSLRLAALASAAVPGLDPMSVQEVVQGKDEHFDVAFIQDTQQRRWVVRAPRTEVAAAHMDASLAMLSLLVRRVPFAVPAAKGFVPIPKIGRAAVHSYIPGQPLDLSALSARDSLTAEVGRTIAMIHNVDRALYDEAGLASYDAEEYRKRHLAEVDRGAATGRVPTALLARWEEALDDVRLWKFAPTPIHGSLSGDDLLVTFPDPTSNTPTVRGVTGWEEAKVADPADDFAAIFAAVQPDVMDAIMKAYAHVRVERPDEHLVARARLGSELSLLATLLRAVTERNEVATEATTARLRRLDNTVHAEGQSRHHRIIPAPPVSGGAPAVAAGASAGATGTPVTADVAQDPHATDAIETVPPLDDVIEPTEELSDDESVQQEPDAGDAGDTDFDDQGTDADDQGTDTDADDQGTDTDADADDQAHTDDATDVLTSVEGNDPEHGSKQGR